jgi:hypothetical protein
LAIFDLAPLYLKSKASANSLLAWEAPPGRPRLNRFKLPLNPAF